jgi:hypothetical protein
MDEIVDRPQRFFYRRFFVPGVAVEQIDSISTKAV